MNLNSKLLKYLDGMRIFESLYDDERAIFPLFALCFDVTSDAVLEQQAEFKRDLQEGRLQELPDYNVDEVSNVRNYTGTGKLKYEMCRFGDRKIIDVLKELIGEEKLNSPFSELYDDYILAKTKQIAEKSREIVEMVNDADPELFEDNFPILLKRYDWTEVEREYLKEKKMHNVSMNWLLEQQERELQKVLEMDIMHYAGEPSTQAIEDSDYPYHRRFLSHKFKDTTDYQEAYTKFMEFATRQDGIIIPKLGDYGKYIAVNINKFRPEQQIALFSIIRKFEMIHEDMVKLKPELAHYLNKREETNTFGIVNSLTRLMQQPWFKEFRTDPKYDDAWIEQFLDNLIKSEWRHGILQEWENARRRSKLKCKIIGAMRDAGILKSDYQTIAEKINMGNELPAETHANYMGYGKAQPYFEWICDYVKG